MKIYDDYAEQVAVEYFSNISNTVGAVGLGIFIGLLHVNGNPQKSALLAFTILFLWVFSQGSEYRKQLKIQKVKPNYGTFIKHGWLSYIGVLLLGCLGLDLIKASWFV